MGLWPSSSLCNTWCAYSISPVPNSICIISDEHIVHTLLFSSPIQIVKCLLLLTPTHLYTVVPEMSSCWYHYDFSLPSPLLTALICINKFSKTPWSGGEAGPAHHQQQEGEEWVSQSIKITLVPSNCASPFPLCFPSSLCPSPLPRSLLHPSLPSPRLHETCIAWDSPLKSSKPAGGKAGGDTASSEQCCGWPNQKRGSLQVYVSVYLVCCEC